MIGFATATAAAMVELISITQTDLEKANVRGTGCSWISLDGSSKFAATDGVAIIKPASGLIRLTPHAKAKVMFPFTFTRWIGKGIDVEVVGMGKGRVINADLVRTPATLRVTLGSRTSRARGGSERCSSKWRTVRKRSVL
jgi:hypothetical protein